MIHTHLFVDLVHSATEQLPVEQRVHALRAVVEQTADSAVAEHFTACADELERSIRNCRQLRLNFGKETR